jgi:hypothetical protein
MKLRQTGKKLNLDDWEWVLKDDPQHRVTISTDSEYELISNETDTLILHGAEYPSFQSALISARRWRQIIAVYFARVGFSVDLGDDREESCIPREMDRIDSRAQPGFTDETTLYWDRIGLYVLPVQPSAIFFHGQGYGENWVSVRQARLMRAIERQNQHPWANELKLAYELFHASLADTNPETQYILAVTAVETLITRQKRAPEVINILDSLIARVKSQADTIGRDLADEIKRLLHEDKVNSISNAGQHLAERLPNTYEGMPPVAYFKHVYRIRSELVHGELRNNWRLTSISDQMRELNRFVLDILAAWTPEHSAPAPQIER